MMDIVERLRGPINEKEDYFISQWPNEEPKTHDAVRFEAADEIERLREALRFYANPYGKCECVPDFYSELGFGDTAEDALNGDKK